MPEVHSAWPQSLFDDAEQGRQKLQADIDAKRRAETPGTMPQVSDAELERGAFAMWSKDARKIGMDAETIKKRWHFVKKEYIATAKVFCDAAFGGQQDE